MSTIKKKQLIMKIKMKVIMKIKFLRLMNLNNNNYNKQLNRNKV